MKQSKISPLEQLRHEKELAKQEVEKSEARLSGQWDYLQSNFNVLLINGAIDATLKGLGLKSSQKNTITQKSSNEDIQSPGIFRSLLGGFSALSPIIWELVQPMLMSFALNKVKSFFSGEKKKKSKDKK